MGIAKYKRDEVALIAREMGVFLLFFLLLLCYAFVSTLMVYKLEDRVRACELTLAKNQAEIKELYGYKDHLIRRLDNVEYPEVLGKKKKKR